MTQHSEIEAVLAERGLAVVRLPKPMPPEDLGDKYALREYAYFADGTVFCNPGHDKVRLQLEDSRLTPDEAEEIAYGLLAAAKLARTKPTEE